MRDSTNLRLEIMADYRRMAEAGFLRCLLTALVLPAVSVPVSVADAQTITILFRGLQFPSTDSTSTGMDQLADSLKRSFGDSFTAEVLYQGERNKALDIISESDDCSCLILIGHSLGGAAAIKLAEEASRSVALLVQFDPWWGTGNKKLPKNVTRGINYFQEPTRLDIGGKIVHGSKSKNYKVEVMYKVDNDKVTHANIDDALFGRQQQEYNSIFNAQDDLHTKVRRLVEEACSPS